MWLKVCGITRVEDAAEAYALGYDAVGMVFAESPRRLNVERAKEICSALPPSILRVGVFAGLEGEEVRSLAEYCGLDLVQLHGVEGEHVAAPFGSRAIVARRPRLPHDLEGMKENAGAFAVLIDAWDPVLAGGTGRTCDWDLAARAARMVRVILAGGLNPSNVGEAIGTVNPFGVDVSSGVESEPGIKDHALMRDFARKARIAAAVAAEEDSYVDK
ncbi:MAG: phosphoribosylanthranilate isomerase [Actinobacteria bacterium]|nr:phosphoribosylanthranilate isomerase [Actinomycetota bacterium]